MCYFGAEKKVMGVDRNFGAAFSKAQLGAGNETSADGAIFISVRDEDKRYILSLASRLHALGLPIIATSGTARALQNNGIPVETVHKIHEGRPHVLDLIKNQQIQLIINTPSGRMERSGREPKKKSVRWATGRLPASSVLSKKGFADRYPKFMKARSWRICHGNSSSATRR